MKRIAGISPKRDLPRFSRQTFRDWFSKRPKTKEDAGQKVFLWVDTFNNYFTPGPLIAAVHVLEAAGCQVIVSSGHLCCGRPLYDYGMLAAAKQLLVDILEGLGEVIAQEIPVIGLEPSCVSVFRDELRNLFPGDILAKRLQSQTYTLAEFLSNWLPGYQPPRISRRLLMHGHCHHKAIMRIDADIDLLKKAGAQLDLPDTGCCGMAGGFGYEHGAHYDVSVTVGERVLLPAVRSAAADTLILADGFSCREQIVQQTGRSALHLAQILHMGILPPKPS
ncbi:MAG TPA: heterodisulfide reductase-related iron-sulfur binding cluster [Chitinophagaceae bacterium]